MDCAGDLADRYPDRAAPIEVSERVYRDIDRQAACLTGYDQKYHQMSAGLYRGWFKTLLLGEEVGVYLETFNQTLEQWGAAPPGQYGFILLMEGSTPCHLAGRLMDRDSLLLMTPGAGFDFRCAPGVRFCVVTVAADAFEPLLEACDAPAPGAATTLLERWPLRVRTLRQLVVQALALAAGDAPSPERRAALSGLRLSLASLLAGYMAARLAGDPPAPRQALARRTLLAEAARDRIRRHRGARLSVETLARDLGASRRGLEYAFRAAFDAGPSEYIRLVRLNEIRSALTSPAQAGRSIGDVAAELGVWHLSRLAQSYRRQFGELPSETRRRLAAPGA